MPYEPVADTRWPMADYRCPGTTRVLRFSVSDIGNRLSASGYRLPRRVSPQLQFREPFRLCLSPRFDLRVIPGKKDLRYRESPKLGRSGIGWCTDPAIEKRIATRTIEIRHRTWQ